MSVFFNYVKSLLAIFLLVSLLFSVSAVVNNPKLPNLKMPVSSGGGGGVTNNYYNNTYNVTYNITNNITNNITYNITNNITNNITYLLNDTFNATYDKWSYNQTTGTFNIYGKWWYNQTQGAIAEIELNYSKWFYNQSIIGYNINSSYSKWWYNQSDGTGGNSSFNQTLTDSLYSSIIWGYNQTIAPTLDAVLDPILPKSFMMGIYSLIFNYNGNVAGTNAFSILGTNQLNKRLLYVSDMGLNNYTDPNPRMVGIAGYNNAIPLIVGVNDTVQRAIQSWEDIYTSTKVAQMDNTGELQMNDNIKAKGTYVQVITQTNNNPFPLNYAVLSTDELIIGIPNTMAVVNINLPVANNFIGQRIVVENGGPGIGGVVVNPNGADTIAGIGAGWGLPAQWQTVNLISDGLNNWAVV